jgi:TPR repeat protein
LDPNLCGERETLGGTRCNIQMRQRPASLVLLALVRRNHYSDIQMLNRALVVLMLFNLGVAIHASGQSVETERRLFSQVKAMADKGDAQAQLQLGSFYANGTGVAPDLRKAFKWHRKAAEQALPPAQYQLGLDYANGEGVKMDKAEAVHWFRAAAEKGFAQAQLELGLCYLDGRGVSESEVEAVKWFRNASSGGLAYADYEIGNCYLQGIGVAKDIEEGIKWIKQAAEKGVAAAQNSLGLAYQKGEGVPKDYLQAYKWLALAAAQDDEHASDIRVSLGKVELNLTKEQVAEAQRLAREFKSAEATSADLKSTQGAGAVSPKQIRSPSANSDHVLSANEGFKTGLVTVKANDDECEVWVDGAFAGNSPAKLQLAEGLHVFEIKKAGFNSFRRELKVTAGSELSLRATLEKQ